MLEIFDYLHNVVTAAVIISLIFGFLIFLLYRKLNFFRSFNPEPLIKNYLPHRDEGHYRFPSIVKTGLLVNEFLIFDPFQNNFVFDGYLWFSFNPSLLTLPILNQFSFEKGLLLQKSEPETEMLPSGELFAKYKIRLKFSENLNFRNFPLDDHRIFILYQLDTVSVDEVLFVTQETQTPFPQESAPAGWKIVDWAMHSGYRTISHQKKRTRLYPCALLFLDFAKKGLRKAVIIVLPIVAIFCVSFLTLLAKNTGEKNTAEILSAGAISGLLAYRFVLETLSPSVSYYTVADHIFTLFLVSTFIVFFINTHTTATPGSFLKLQLAGFFLIPLGILASLFIIFKNMTKSS